MANRTERRVLEKVRRLRNQLGIYTELEQLLLENEANRAAAAENEAARLIKRELAEKNFGALDVQAVKEAILEGRLAEENKAFLKLQRDTLSSGKILDGEELKELAARHEARLAAIREETEDELKNVSLPPVDAAKAAENAAETEIKLNILHESFALESAKRVEAIKAKNEKHISQLRERLENAERRLENSGTSDNSGELSEGCTLSVRNLKMYFGGVKAVDDLSFDVREGEIFGLIGPNGAGKTTVFNCITQFYKPTAGTLMFKGSDGEIVDLTREKVHDVILRGIVRTFQNVEVVPEMSVLENLLVAGHRQFSSGIAASALHLPMLRLEEKVVRARAVKVLDFMGLTAYKDNYAFGLPYGILKKIEIARTLMCTPRLIILDEPAAGLNDTETAELAQLIRRIRDEYNCTILLVEHDMGLVMDVCDNICAISFGKLLAYGTPEQIQADKNVQQAYLGVDEEDE